MGARFSANLGIVVAILIALCTIVFSERIVAQTTCQNGLISAPAMDSIFGITQGTCVNTSLQQQLDGGCNFNPYQVLQQYANSGVLLTPQVASAGSSQLQNGINATLACRLAQFLQYAQAQGHPMTITSGYRSIAKQQQTCEQDCPNHNPNGCSGTCGTPGKSCHQYGLAVDLGCAGGGSACLTWANNFLGLGAPAAGGQQFKIFFPLSSDKDHVQCIENTVAACSASTQPCGGTTNNFYPGQSIQTAGTLSPTLSNTVGNPLLPAQPTTIAGSPFATTPVTTTQAAQSCTPQYFCSANTVYYQSSSCNTQVFQACQYGCSTSGTTCNASAQSTTTSSQVLSSTPSSNPIITSTAPIGTSTSIALNNGLTQSGQGMASSTASTSIITTIIPGGEQYVGGQTTFSSDLSSAANTSALSPLQQLLQNLRATLVALLSYL